MQVCRRRVQERCFLICAPNIFRARATINAASPLARIDGDLTAIFRPRKNACQDGPCIVSLAPRLESKFVAPFHKDSTRAAVCKTGQREIGKFRLDLVLDNSLVVATGAWCELAEIFARLICDNK